MVALLAFVQLLVDLSIPRQHRFPLSVSFLLPIQEDFLGILIMFLVVFLAAFLVLINSPVVH